MYWYCLTEKINKQKQKRYISEVIRSPQCASPPQQYNGFMATGWLYTTTCGVGTLYIIPSIKTTSLVVLSNFEAQEEPEHSEQNLF